MGRRRATSRLLAAIASLGAVGGAALMLPAVAHAQVSFNESFTGSNAPGWVFGGSGYTPTLTAATGIDTPGNGWLRLTDNGNNRATYALLDTQIFSVNARIEITMDYAFWNGSGADGITFFLVDGNVSSSTFTPGAYGGSMGYAQRDGVAGMPGGYLGFALDNFGNYSNGSEGRNGGITTNGTLYPNRVAVRGPESSGYEFIAASGALPQQMDFPSYTTRPNQAGADYRSFKIIFDANNQLDVQMKFGASGGYSSVFTADLSGYERPDTFKIGFTGATGGSTEIHEVRNISLVSTPWSSGSGAYEWDNGAGTTAWGGTPGAANTNWYSAVTADDNKTPTAKSDVLFGNRPTNNGANNTQSVQLSSNVEVRNLTFDTGINYTLGTVGAGQTITFGKNSAGVGLPSINVNDYNGAYARHKINADIALLEDIAIRNFSYSTLCLNGTLETAGHDITVSGTGAVNFNGDISGSGSLIKNGAGITTINNNNADDPAGTPTAWTGAVTVNAGMLVVTADGALGSTSALTTVNSGGTLAFRGGVNYTTAEVLYVQGNGITRNTGQLAGAIHNDGGDNTFAGEVILAGNAAIGSRAGNLTLSGQINSDGVVRSLTKVGDGVVTLSNSGNSWLGETIIAGGSLRITNSVDALAGGFATDDSANNYPALNLAGGVLDIGLAATFQRSVGTGEEQVRWTGDGGFAASGDANRTVNLGGAGATLTWGAASFVPTGNALVLGSTSANRTLDFQNAINLGTALREVRVIDGASNATGAVDGVISGVISGTGALGAGGLNKTGDGTLELTANNTYTGDTRISGGALRVGAADRIDGTNLVLSGGVLEISGDLDTANAGDFTRSLGGAADQVRWTGDGGFAATGAARTVRLNNGTATVTWDGSNGFLGAGNTLILGADSSNNTVTLANSLALGATGSRTVQTVRGTDTTVASGALGGVVSGSSALEVSGNGRLDLTANNTHTGAVTVTGAELRPSGNGDLAQSSGFVVRQGGVLSADNTNTSITDRLGNSAAISLQGGTLNLYGRNANADTTETVGVVTLASGANTINSANGANNGSAQLTLSGLSRSSTAATVNFTNLRTDGVTIGGTLGGSGDNSRVLITGQAATTAQTSTTGSILGGWATAGDNWAIYNATTGVQALSNYQTGGETTWASANVSVGSAQTLTADRTVNSLRLNGASAGQTVDLDNDSTARTLTVQTGGILSVGANTNVITADNAGSALRAGTASELVVHTQGTNNILQINAQISDNAGTKGLVKSGEGTLQLGGSMANTYTGVTTVNAGTLVLGKSDGVTAIAGSGDSSTATKELVIGDGRGIDTLRLAANEQIANTVDVQLRGGAVGNAANVARLELNGAANETGASRIETFRSLDVTGNSVLDFGGGTVCAPTFLYLDSLTVAADALLNITNWIEFTDFLLVKKDGFDSSQLSRVIFDGYPGRANWQSYDANYFQITPVPEPATTGLMGLGSLGFVAFWRRRFWRSRQRTGKVSSR